MLELLSGFEPLTSSLPTAAEPSSPCCTRLSGGFLSKKDEVTACLFHCFRPFVSPCGSACGSRPLAIYKVFPDGSTQRRRIQLKSKLQAKLTEQLGAKKRSVLFSALCNHGRTKPWSSSVQREKATGLRGSAEPQRLRTSVVRQAVILWLTFHFIPALTALGGCGFWAHS